MNTSGFIIGRSFIRVRDIVRPGRVFMKQEYHTNAGTNLHICKQIKKSSLKNIELAETFNTSVATISKWRNRQELQDKSSRPCNIIYALNELEQGLAISIRKTTWLPLDEVWETLLFELKP